MSNEIDKILKKIENGRAYRTAQTFNAKDGEDEGTVEGYATVFNTPYTLFQDGDFTINEVIDRHAFDDCDMTDVIMQYNHEGRVFARISNGTLEVEPKDEGLYCVANLSGTSEGRALYEEIKGGYTTKMSFGFTVDEDKIEIVEEGDSVTATRTILKIGKLYDVSAVSIPANDATSISARQFSEGVIAEIEEERLMRAQVEKAKAECLLFFA